MTPEINKSFNLEDSCNVLQGRKPTEEIIWDYFLKKIKKRDKNLTSQ